MKSFNNRCLKFTKASGKTDRLEFRAGSDIVVQLQSPKQGFIPHDLVHYAVETCFPFEGFLQLVFKGHKPEAAMEVLHGFAPKLPGEYSQTSWITESLVESFQAAIWSSNSSFLDFEYLYQKACEARKVAAAPITEADYAKCRSMIDELGSQWGGIDVGGTLELAFVPRLTE